MNGDKTALAGDRLYIPGRPPATILVGGGPPYRVVYDGSKTTVMVVPGPDAVLKTVPFAEVAAGLPEPTAGPDAPARKRRKAGAAAQKQTRAEIAAGEAP